MIKQWFDGGYSAGLSKGFTGLLWYQKGLIFWDGRRKQPKETCEFKALESRFAVPIASNVYQEMNYNDKSFNSSKLEVGVRSQDRTSYEF